MKTLRNRHKEARARRQSDEEADRGNGGEERERGRARMEEMRFGAACVVSLEAGFSSSVPGQVKRTHRKVKKCGAVPPSFYRALR